MAAIREQMALGLEYGANGKAELRDAAAADNKALPIHRWVPWIAGFSGTFARDAIEAYLPTRGRRQHLVLDPFAGVGTTLVEALKLGCHASGFEVNKFAALAAQAKVNCIDVEPGPLRRDVEVLRDSVARFEERIDRAWAEGRPTAIGDTLETLQLAAPPHFRSRIPLFSPPVEAKFLYALRQAEEAEEPHRTLLRVALGATMISVSNYSYEPSLSTRPGAGKPLIENASVASAVLQKLAAIADDIEWARSNYGSLWAKQRRDVTLASYLDSGVRPKSVSLLLTSPPYMNNYHYVRNTRPQLYWLGLVDGPDELRAYEEQSFGKFWQTVRQSATVELDFELPPLAALVGTLRGLSVERGAYGGPGWANYVATYFNDMWRFLQLVKQQLRPGGRAIIVVGNSIIQGLEFKVDQLLGDTVERLGLTVEDIRLVRTKRVGNSIIDSAVRNGHDASHKHKTQLYDAAVILRN